MVNPWLGMGLVLTILGGSMAGLHAYRRLRSPHPELVRKLLHVGMGLVTLTFPWLFGTAWPVLFLAGGSILGLIALKTSAPLRHRLGDVIHGVARASVGEIYFPLAVALLFLLSAGDALLFCIPMLILTLADAVAALIGVRYGLVHYTTAEGEKSVEGSTAFFTVAFLSTHIPLLLFTNTGRAEALLVALTVGFLVMLLEAIAWQGLDNLFIPLGAFILLKTSLTMDVAALAAPLGVMVLLVIFALFCRRHTTLNDSALLGAALVGYGSWAVGGWHWLLPPLILFISYPLLSPRTDQNSRRTRDIYAVISVASAGLVWLFLAETLGRPEFYYPYTLAFAAHLAIIGIARLKYEYPQISGTVLLGTCSIKGWLLLFVPFLLIEGLTEMALVYALAAPFGVALAALAFWMTQPGLDNYPTDTARWLRQAGAAAAGSALGLILL